MVKDLKEESDKTPETDVLSLSLVKKVEEIEKLAPQIRDRIRANVSAFTPPFDFSSEGNEFLSHWNGDLRHIGV